ncbi:hypothetical protein GW750_08960 [bacterium]|nr:hypothetical protein [bacterium]
MTESGKIFSNLDDVIDGVLVRVSQILLLTLCTCVSTATAAIPKRIDQTTLAVFSPTHASCVSHDIVSGSA